MDIPTSPRFREIVGMAVLPMLDHCAAGLDIAVIRPRLIVTHEGRPPINKPVRVINSVLYCLCFGEQRYKRQMTTLDLCNVFHFVTLSCCGAAVAKSDVEF